MDACYNADGSRKCGIPAKGTPINNPQKKVTNVKPKILSIGDSITANVNIKLLAHATEANLLSLASSPNKVQVSPSTNKSHSSLLENKIAFKKV